MSVHVRFDFEVGVSLPVYNQTGVCVFNFFGLAYLFFSIPFEFCACEISVFYSLMSSACYLCVNFVKWEFGAFRQTITFKDGHEDAFKTNRVKAKIPTSLKSNYGSFHRSFKVIKNFR